MSDRGDVGHSGDRAERLIERSDTDELVALLHEADGYLSLIGYRYREVLATSDGIERGYELAEELKQASTKCRSMVKRIEAEGLALRRKPRTLTEEDWNA